MHQSLQAQRIASPCPKVHESDTLVTVKPHRVHCALLSRGLLPRFFAVIFLGLAFAPRRGRVVRVFRQEVGVVVLPPCVQQLSRTRRCRKSHSFWFMTCFYCSLHCFNMLRERGRITSILYQRLLSCCRTTPVVTVLITVSTLILPSRKKAHYIQVTRS